MLKEFDNVQVVGEAASVDEAIEKIQSWQALHPDRDIKWHYIGAIQSRKASVIAEHFDWAHSVDRLKVAQKS